MKHKFNYIHVFEEISLNFKIFFFKFVNSTYHKLNGGAHEFLNENLYVYFFSILPCFQPQKMENCDKLHKLHKLFSSIYGYTMHDLIYNYIWTNYNIDFFIILMCNINHKLKHFINSHLMVSFSLYDSQNQFGEPKASLYL